MQATLRIVHQRANLQQIRLVRDTLVGRSTDCQLKIASPQVSRRHCRLSLCADGVYLEDLGSANGTFLDGVRVQAATPTYVSAGTRLDIGPARFIVEYGLSDSSTQLVGLDTAMLKAPPTPAKPVAGKPSADQPASVIDEPDRAVCPSFAAGEVPPTSRVPGVVEDEALQQFLRQL